MQGADGVARATGAAIGGDERQLVLFQVGAELYGIDIAGVHEIIRLQAITRVPRAPACVEGIILDRVLARDERRALDVAA